MSGLGHGINCHAMLVSTALSEDSDVFVLTAVI